MPSEPLSGDPKPPTSLAGTLVSDLKRHSGSFNPPLGKGRTYDVLMSTHNPELSIAGTEMEETEVKKVMRVVPGNFKNTSRSRGGDILLRLRKNFSTKFELWMSLSHPNIAQIWRVAPDELTLYQEHCSSGDLREYVKSNLSEIDYIRIIKDILSGLSYLHSRDSPIAHGCINPGKIYVAGGITKLGEFGLSQTVAKIPHLVPSISVTGMTRWMSPEYFRGSKPGVFTTQGDIWSFGCTLLEIFTGDLPYHQNKYDMQVLTKIMSDALPGELELASYKKGELSYASTQLIKGFITQCWFPFEKRPSSHDLLNQPTDEIFSYLVSHCCTDVTLQLDFSSTIMIRAGGYGNIFSGHLYDGTKVALKVPGLILSGIPAKIYNLLSAHELYIWSRCNHPNVLRLIGATIFQGNIALVTPWIEQGDLSSYWHQRDPLLELDHLSICIQISEGLSYLHGMGVIHGDIKGGNILLSSDMIPKICDFDQAVLLNPDDVLQFEEFDHRCTLRWAAPERIIQDDEKSRPTVKSDVYSLGMTILEVTTGNIPWANLMTDVMVYIRKARGDYPERPQLPFPDDQANRLWELLTRCWDLEPNNRPTAAEVRDSLKDIIAMAKIP